MQLLTISGFKSLSTLEQTGYINSLFKKYYGEEFLYIDGGNVYDVTDDTKTPINNLLNYVLGLNYDIDSLYSQAKHFFKVTKKQLLEKYFK